MYEIQVFYDLITIIVISWSLAGPIKKLKEMHMALGLCAADTWPGTYPTNVHSDLFLYLFSFCQEKSVLIIHLNAIIILLFYNEIFFSHHWSLIHS